MEQAPFHILWVSSTRSIPKALQQIAQRQAAPVHLGQAAPYDPAIQAVQAEAPDAVFVADDFGHLSVLEFVHHTRLLSNQIPVVIVTGAYDASLDHKAHKLGATDCVPLHALDSQYLNDLLLKQQPASGRANRQPMKRKSVLQMPVLFK